VHRWIASLLFCAAFALTANSWAQDDAPESPVEPATTERPAVEEVELETFYFRDDKGEFVPLISGLSFEEWLKLYRIHKKLEAPEPVRRFSMVSMTLRGTSRKDSIQVKANFRVRVLLPGWSRVPLRLDRALQTKEAVYRGDGEMFVEFSEKEGEGHVLWLKGEANTVHSIELDLMLPVSQIGGESRIALHTPKVSTATFHLTAPGANLEITSLDGANLRNSKKVGTQTQWELIGLSGEFGVSWRNALKAAAPVVITAQTQIRAEFDGAYHARSIANITVDAHSDGIDSFLVRLPDGMQASPEDAATQRRYQIATLSVAEKASRRLPERIAAGEVVEIKLNRKTTEKVEVTLRAIRNPGVARPPEESVELAEFEVVGASHQSGVIDIALDRQWNLRWEANEVVRQDNIPLSVRESGVVARFFYSKQPCSLKVHAAAKQTRVRVEPLYIVRISDTQAQLEGRLLYRIRGASEASIKFNGWNIREVGPDSLVEANQIDFEKIDPLSIVISPLDSEAGDELELLVKAFRLIDESGQFELPIPQALATALAPATLVVIPADNVRLSIDEDASTGLSTESLPPSLELGDSANPPLFFRINDKQEQAVFAGTVEPLEQSLALNSDTTLTLTGNRAEYRQRLTYSIANAPISNLQLEVPRAYLGANNLRVQLGDQWLTTSQPTSKDESLRTTIEVALPSPRTGEVELELSYHGTLPDFGDQSSSDWQAEIITPADSNVIVQGNEIAVVSRERVHAHAVENEWSLGEPEGEGEELQMSSDRWLSTAALTLHATSESPSGGIIVEKAWLQTWLTADQRRDRATFEVWNVKGQFQIQLPRGANVENAIVAINGKRTAYLLATDQTLELQVPENLKAPSSSDETLDSEISLANQITAESGTSAAPLVVEVWYTFRLGRSPAGSIEVNMPTVVDATRMNRFFWQVLLPSNEYLLADPANLTSEAKWGWQGFYFGRRASLSQRDLESWIGASRQVELPPEGNQYLFSSFATVESVETYTATRIWALLAATLLVMGVILMLVYVPFARHPIVLLVIASAAVVAAFFYPHAALQFAQASGVSLIIGGFAFVAQWLMSRGHHAVPPQVRGGMLSQHSGETRQSDVIRVRVEGDSQASTAAAVTDDLVESESAS